MYIKHTILPFDHRMLYKPSLTGVYASYTT